MIRSCRPLFFNAYDTNTPPLLSDSGFSSSNLMDICKINWLILRIFSTGFFCLFYMLASGNCMFLLLDDRSMVVRNEEINHLFL